VGAKPTSAARQFRPLAPSPSPPLACRGSDTRVLQRSEVRGRELHSQARRISTAEVLVIHEKIQNGSRARRGFCRETELRPCATSRGSGHRHQWTAQLAARGGLQENSRNPIVGQYLSGDRQFISAIGGWHPTHGKGYGRHTIRAPCWDYPIAARSTATVHRRGSTNTPMECPPKPDQSSTNRARGPALCRSPTDKARPTASYHLHTCRRSARRSQARVTEIRRGNLRLRSASTANQQPGKQHSRFDPSSTLHNSSFKFRLVSIWTLSHAAS